MFECPACGKAFDMSENLLKHMVVTTHQMDYNDAVKWLEEEGILEIEN